MEVKEDKIGRRLFLMQRCGPGSFLLSALQGPCNSTTGRRYLLVTSLTARRQVGIASPITSAKHIEDKLWILSRVVYSLYENCCCGGYPTSSERPALGSHGRHLAKCECCGSLLQGSAATIKYSSNLSFNELHGSRRRKH